MVANSKLSVTEKLLLAANRIGSSGERAFTAEDLVVSAWQLFPRTFGLRGYNDQGGMPIYPDSNRVFAEIMGSKPIRKRGYLVKVGKKMYELTASGRDMAMRLEGRHGHKKEIGEEREGRATISRAILGKLERLLSTRAVKRAIEDEFNRVTFHDACVFWGISPSSTSIDLEGSLADVQTVIDQTEEAINAGASELRTGSRDLSISTAEILRKVHEQLQEKFRGELNTISQRTDQRGAS